MSTTSIQHATPGQVAYEGYYKQCGGKSLISGVPLPSWESQNEVIRESWEAAARSVIAMRSAASS